MGIINIQLLFPGDSAQETRSFYVGEPNQNGVFVISGDEVIVTSDTTFQIKDVATDNGDGSYTVSNT